LVISGLPYLIEEEGLGHHVEVDIFSVTGTVLQRLDMLESHPVWYQRKRVAIDTKDGQKECWIYFNIKTKIKATDTFYKKYEGYTNRYGFGKDYYGNTKPKNTTTTPTTITPKFNNTSYDEWVEKNNSWNKYPVHPKKPTPPPTVDTAFSEVTDAFQEKPLTNEKWKKMVKEQDVKEYCRSCWSALEHDMYGNYYCHECNDWRAGFEIVRF
jgi:gamma-glutamylcyclotransferase (GGCT)/AIG2-like uncharacterized protein YtfP